MFLNPSKLLPTFLWINAFGIFFLSSAKTAEEWKTRIIYQILTDRFAQSGSLPTTKCTDMRGWCGGTFKGIENHLDYITGLGANAIWISPIVLNTEKGFHGYWAKNIYEIETHFGTKEELKSLVRACHERDVWVMVDIVANHMGYPPGTNWITPWNSSLFDRFYENLYPFNRSEYFHPNHPYIKWPEQCHDVKKIQEYWLANLPDLNQSHPFVEKALVDWIHYLINEYDFDGCRVDTVIQVPKDFWTKFQKAGRVFMLGEANNGPPPCGTLNFTAGFQGPLNSVLDFPLFWTHRYILQERKQNFSTLSKYLKDSTKIFLDRSVLGGFIDNHDHARFLHFNPSYIALRNNLAYLFMSQCIPILYYGTEQGFNGDGDPNNRESLWPYMNTSHVLYTFIQHLIKVRRDQGSNWLESTQIERYVSHNFYSFSREKLLVVITTESSTTSATIQSHPYKAGQYLKNMLNPKQSFKVSSNGELVATLFDGEPLVLAESKSAGVKSLPSAYSLYSCTVLLVFFSVSKLCFLG